MNNSPMRSPTGAVSGAQRKSIALCKSDFDEDQPASRRTAFFSKRKWKLGNLDNTPGWNRARGNFRTCPEVAWLDRLSPDGKGLA
jgi:hypothetical protein